VVIKSFSPAHLHHLEEILLAFKRMDYVEISAAVSTTCLCCEPSSTVAKPGHAPPDLVAI
jgi:hypothetical protein